MLLGLKSGGLSRFRLATAVTSPRYSVWARRFTLWTNLAAQPQSLVLALRDRKGDAFVKALARYGPLIRWRLMWQQGLSEAEAEEIAAEVIEDVAMWENRRLQGRWDTGSLHGFWQSPSTQPTRGAERRVGCGPSRFQRR